MIKQWLFSFLFLCFFILVPCLLTAQHPEKISSVHFLPVFGEEKLIAHKTYGLNNRDSVELNTFRFYVSDVLGRDKKEKLIYHLVDISDTVSLIIPMRFPNTDVGFHFLLGIDSLTNEMGIGDGDLDPTKGMYWTWQSGYINIKLEGTYTDSIKNKIGFTFHLGGFRLHNLACQIIPLKISQSNSSEDVRIKIDMKEFFQMVDIRLMNKIMSPSAQAVDVSKKLASLFSLMR